MTLCKHKTEKDNCLDCYKLSICPHGLGIPIQVRKCLICMNLLNCYHKAHRGDCLFCKPKYCSICDVISDRYHISSIRHVRMKLFMQSKSISSEKSGV